MKYLFIFLSVINFSLIMAQGPDDGGGAITPPDFNTIVKVPNSPEASAFIQYGTTPISMYTGRPDISIPIHRIQGRELSLPISLSYDASGVKVSQIATNVGLGWNLNAGGVVSRQVNGLADEVGGIDSDPRQGVIRELYKTGPQGFHPSGWIPMFFQQMTERNYGESDFVPDVFSFNINGLSGEIAIDYSKKILGTTRYVAYCINDPSIKVDYVGQGTIVTSWIITGPNGTVYRFGKAEITRSSFSNDANEGTHTYTSAWYITSITNANQTETISFEYTNGKYWDTEQPFYGANTITHNLNSCTSSPTQGYSTTSTPNDYKIFQFNLKNIKLNGVSQVVFIEGSERTDLPGRKGLQHIRVQDDHGRTINNIELKQSYFIASSPTSITSKPELNYRLKLDEVHIKDVGFPTGTVVAGNSVFQAPQKYRFEYYNEDMIPHRFSTTQDYWGYNNGKSSSNLVPKKILNKGTTHQIVLPGADRSADLSHTLAGTLKKIHYPTGGNSAFWYDLHRTPKQFENQTKTVVIGGASLRGGLTSDFVREDYASCDDAINEAKAPVKKDSEPFTIEEDGHYKVELTVNTVGIQTTSTIGIGALAAIYKSNKGTGECFESPLGDGGTICDFDGPVQPYCYLHNNTTSNVPFLQEGSNLTPGTFNVYFPAGDYRAVVLSEYTNKSYSLTVTKTVPVQVELDNRVGGLRVYKTQDQASLNGKKLTKYYYYDDISAVAPLAITPELLSNQDSSSGIAHKALIFDDTSSFVSYGGCEDGCDTFTSLTLSRYANNIASPTALHVSYSRVSEIAFDGNMINGYTVHHFYNNRDASSTGVYKKKNFNNGKPKQIRTYDHSGRILREDSNTFEQVYFSDQDMPKAIGTVVNSKKSFAEGYACTAFYRYQGDPEKTYYGYAVSSCTTVATSPGNSETPTIIKAIHPDCNGNGTAIGTIGGNYAFYSSNRVSYPVLWSKLSQSKSTEYHPSGPITTTKTYHYDNLEHLQPTSIISEISNGVRVTTKTQYPQDIDIRSEAEQKLIDQYRITTPIQVERIEEHSIGATPTVSKMTQKTNYHLWTSNIVSPKTIDMSKDGGLADSRVIYHRYNDQGNPLEVSQPDGRHIAYIWGYQDMYPIAKIENATYDQVQPYETDLRDKANADNDRCRQSSCTEQILREALQDLREALPNAMVTTYTYDPLIGVTSMTDPRGYTTFYEYDGFNRLMHIWDADQKLTDKFYYYYTNQLFTPVEVSITSSPWVFTNTTMVVPSVASGGSGDFSYHWEVKKPGGIVEEHTSKDLTLQGGTTDGMAVITLTVTDNVTGKKETANRSISIYNPLSVSATNISRPANVVVRSNASFSISPSKGSGNYTYAWRIYNSQATYRSNNKSFSMTMGCDYYGQVRIECTVTDTVTEESTLVTTTMQVQPELWGISSFSTRRYSSPTRTKKLEVIANISGGSGSYSYKWYLDGAYDGSSSTGMVTLRCDGKRSVIVKCVVTDQCTGVSATRSQNYSMSTSECSTGGGGGDGDGDPDIVVPDTNQ